MGLTGQMEHENGGSEYLKENSCLEGAGSWEGSMMNREGSPWLRALGVRGFVLDLCIELLKGLQWTVSQDYCRLGTLCGPPRNHPNLYVFYPLLLSRKYSFPFP